jgi:hypothetical protein
MDEIDDLEHNKRDLGEN